MDTNRVSTRAFQNHIAIQRLRDYQPRQLAPAGIQIRRHQEQIAIFYFAT
jgi:hypothetical protein